MKRLKTAIAWGILGTATAVVLGFVGFLLYQFLLELPDFVQSEEGRLFFILLGACAIVQAIFWAAKTLFYNDDNDDTPEIHRA
jgi:hypothetical protein